MPGSTSPCRRDSWRAAFRGVRSLRAGLRWDVADLLRRRVWFALVGVVCGGGLIVRGVCRPHVRMVERGCSGEESQPVLQHCALVSAEFRPLAHEPSSRPVLSCAAVFLLDGFGTGVCGLSRAACRRSGRAGVCRACVRQFGCAHRLCSRCAQRARRVAHCVFGDRGVREGLPLSGNHRLFAGADDVVKACRVVCARVFGRGHRIPGRFGEASPVLALDACFPRFLQRAFPHCGRVSPRA